MHTHLDHKMNQNMKRYLHSQVLILALDLDQMFENFCGYSKENAFSLFVFKLVFFSLTIHCQIDQAFQNKFVEGLVVERPIHNLDFRIQPLSVYLKKIFSIKQLKTNI